MAVAGAEGDNSTGDGDTADGVGAVANPILEVDVLAQAGGVSVGTTKGGSQSDHVVHAELTTLREGADITLGHNSSDEGAKNNGRLHFDAFKSID